jgi:hypothetical protein
VQQRRRPADISHEEPPSRRTGTPQGRTEIAQVGDGRAARLALDLNVVGIVVVKNDQRASAES